APLLRPQFFVRPTLGTHETEQHGFGIWPASPFDFGILREHRKACSHPPSIIDDFESACADHARHIGRRRHTGTRSEHLVPEETCVYSGEDNEQSLRLHTVPLTELAVLSDPSTLVRCIGRSGGLNRSRPEKNHPTSAPLRPGTTSLTPFRPARVWKPPTR